MKTDLAITGIGLMTANGFSGVQTHHNVRAGISRLSLQKLPDLAKKPLSGGRVMTWVPRTRSRRLEVFANQTCREALAQARLADRRAVPAIACLLGAPEATRPGYAFPESQAVAERWAAAQGLSAATLEIRQADRCAGHANLTRAEDLLASGTATHCLIGASDSQLQLKTTRWHERNRRLKTSYINDGFVPGEASAFLVVERPATALRDNVPIIAHLTAVAGGFEAANILSDRPNTAAALTATVRGALQDSSADVGEITGVWSDLNGESYRAREWAYAEVRNGFGSSTELFHPIDCFGDTGAATDTVLLCLAALQLGTQRTTGRQLVFSGNDSGGRAASVLVGSPEPAITPGNTSELPSTYSNPGAVIVPVPDKLQLEESVNPARDLFDWELRQEYRDRMASLYYQRAMILTDGTVPWRRAAEPEGRLLAHTDAVLASGRDALASVLAGSLENEPGQVFAAGFLAGCLGSEQVSVLIERIRPDGPEWQRALFDGLKFSPDPAVPERAIAWIRSAEPLLAELGLELLGYRRCGDASAVEPLLASPLPRLRAAAVRASRRLGPGNQLAELRQLARDDTAMVAAESLWALFEARAPGTGELCQRHLDSKSYDSVSAPAAARVLAALGEANCFDMLETYARITDDYEPLGILGTVAAAPLLIEKLESDDDASGGATVALQTLLGPVEEDQEKDPAAWTARLETVSGASASGRIRGGMAFGPTQCLAELLFEKAPFASRDRALTELRHWTGRNYAFECDDFVARQTQLLARWQYDQS